MTKDPVSFHRRPFLTPIWLTGLAIVLGLSLAIFAAWVWGTAGSTTVVVIRHAEKDSGNAVDPPLSDAGQARALLLARMFGDGQALGHLDAIYTSAALRNRSTAAPVAQRLGIQPLIAPTGDPRGLARRALHEHSGGRVMIVGHADTIPSIVEALSGAAVPEVGADEYGTMYIIAVPRIGHANVLRLHY